MKLLLVEDDAGLANVVRRGLVEQGYGVDLAASVLAASEALGVHSYDLVIIDVGLPDGNGFDLCRTVRSTGVTVPVLMLTARDAVADKVAGLDAGADDYLTKPFDYEELAARVRALLRRAPLQSGAVLSFADIELDTASHVVRRSGVQIPLTPREFGLLDYLLRHPHTVLTRTALLEHVWDEFYDGLSNVVDVHMANLRRKLGEPVIIETVRGVGYRMAL